MQRPSELAIRIRSLLDLDDVVGALRSLSAARVQQARSTLLAIREYAGIVEAALATALPLTSTSAEGDEARAASTAVVAFCSEHGFVGAFNERVLSRAMEHLGSARDRLMIVGSRGLLENRAHAQGVAWSTPMASHIGGVDDVALQVAEELAKQSAAGVSRVVLAYTRASSGRNLQVAVETLLPFDLHRQQAADPDPSPPLRHLPPERLLESLVDELLFAELTRATVESFASESSARLQAMESASENIEGKLDELRRAEREGRQEEITTELLDIITGVEAMNDQH